MQSVCLAWSAGATFCWGTENGCVQWVLRRSEALTTFQFEACCWAGRRAFSELFVTGSVQNLQAFSGGMMPSHRMRNGFANSSLLDRSAKLTPGPFIVDLPNEVLCRIFRFLESAIQKRLQSVCTRWDAVLNSPPVLKLVSINIAPRTRDPFFVSANEGKLQSARLDRVIPILSQVVTQETRTIVLFYQRLRARPETSFVDCGKYDAKDFVENK